MARDNVIYAYELNETENKLGEVFYIPCRIEHDYPEYEIFVVKLGGPDMRQEITTTCRILVDTANQENLRPEKLAKMLKNQLEFTSVLIRKGDKWL